MSRYTWVFLMQFKTGVIVVLKKFLSMIKTQFSAIVKIIRSDNGIEFLNVKYNEMLDSYGIIHQSSCAYIPQQNGVVKRKHRHILDVTRALKFQAGIPTRFSGRMLLDLESKHLLVSRDVVFKEHIFPFKKDMYVFFPFSVQLSAFTRPRDRGRLADHEEDGHYDDHKNAQTQTPLDPAHNSTDTADEHTQNTLADHDTTGNSEGNNSFDDDEFEDSLTALDSGSDEWETQLDLAADATPQPHTLDTEIADLTPTTTVDTSETLRKSGRISKAPLWLQDYITNNKTNGATLYSIADYMCYDNVTQKYRCYLAKISTLTEPQNFKEASKDRK
ncbi:uncharacterized protein LOC142177317 [Nicotiana tabacum]|uniref:Uncharacterized protein LOC142177317 n=1 Tax=Nicotiana tabacum TaxID=4097 RepID=A0AC58TXE8_TOBAC